MPAVQWRTFALCQGLGGSSAWWMSRSWGSGADFQCKVHGPNQLWDFLLAHGDGIIEVPPDRWSLDRYYDPDPDMRGRMYTRSGGFLQDSLWDFDREFFGISPREASIMDPQQRLLLEVTQEAMDDAGVSSRASSCCAASTARAAIWGGHVGPVTPRSSGRRLTRLAQCSPARPWCVRKSEVRPVLRLRLVGNAGEQDLGGSPRRFSDHWEAGGPVGDS